MTGVQKLPLLPAPGTKPMASSDAASPAAATKQGVEAVAKTPPLRARDDQGNLQRRWEDQEAAAAERRPGRVAREDAARDHAAQGPAKGRQVSFSRLSSMPFMVQVLGQQALASKGLQPAPQSTSLSQHRDGALMGSEIYRKAGGEPELLPEDATFVRFAV
ncbi:hypothetical protein [Pelagibius sp.]|uniref:hypothetical protein n=1 Tax=Pelagibius sp. TaxID=1931238 RepID=UPI003BB12F23